MAKSGVEHLAAHPGWKTKKKAKAQPNAKIEHLDASDVATVLAALRLFQREYQDVDAVHIADAWPMHFNVKGEKDPEVVPQPLGSEDIDALCERINCAKVLSLP
jgi:hypothetical protein